MADENLLVVLARLEAAGYHAQFSAVDGLLRCGECGYAHDPSGVVIEEMVRLEGETDPDDEAAVFAVSCRACGARGTYVTAFGIYVSADDAEVVRQLRDARAR